MTPYQIILADDHVMIRKGLRKTLEGVSDLEVVGEAGDGLELLELLDIMTPHLVVLDISMPNLRGLEALPKIKLKYPDIKVLVLTMHKDIAYLQQALSAGADGYLLKEDACRDLFSAIEKIRQGKKYLSSRLSEELADDLTLGRNGCQGSFSEPLTERERDVLKLIVGGKSNVEIAGVLSISVRTVETHRANMMTKLNLKNTAELVRYAFQNGLA